MKPVGAGYAPPMMVTSGFVRADGVAADVVRKWEARVEVTSAKP